MPRLGVHSQYANAQPLCERSPQCCQVPLPGCPLTSPCLSPQCSILAAPLSKNSSPSLPQPLVPDFWQAAHAGTSPPTLTSCATTTFSLSPPSSLKAGPTRAHSPPCSCSALQNVKRYSANFSLTNLLQRRERSAPRCQPAQTTMALVAPLCWAPQRLHTQKRCVADAS